MAAQSRQKSRQILFDGVGPCGVAAILQICLFGARFVWAVGRLPRYLGAILLSGSIVASSKSLAAGGLRLYLGMTFCAEAYMRNHTRIATLVFGVIVALAGCATQPAAPLPEPEPAPDPAEQRLQAALAQARAEREVGVDQPAPKPSFGWQETTVDYFGDAAVFLRLAAEGAGKRFHVTGPGPHIPMFIRIQSAQEPLEEVLRRVALQMGGRADIALRDDAIELRYRAH